MSVYIVVQFTILDARAFERYAVKSRETISRFGGRVIARGTAEPLKAEAFPELGAILEFPDRKAAQSWFQSSDYQALTTLRDASSDTTFLMYPAFEGD